MALAIDFSLGPSATLRTGVRSAWVRVHDSDHDAVQDATGASFDYALLYLNDMRDDDQRGGPVDPTGPVEIRLWRVSVQRAETYHGLYGSGEEFSLAKLRELPLQTWESAARLHLAEAVTQDEFRAAVRETTAPNELIEVGAIVVASGLHDLERSAAATVESLHPELRPDGTATERRSYNSHLKLALVGLQYNELIKAGRNDPSSEIARLHDITPVAARALVHRARKAGYLGKSIGRTAGHRPAAVITANTARLVMPPLSAHDQETPEESEEE